MVILFKLNISLITIVYRYKNIFVFLGDNLLIPRLVDTQVATLTAVDYDGNRRNLGGDPVVIKLIGPLDDTQQEMAPNNLGHQHQDNNTSDDGVRIIDHKNGQYTIRLRLSNCGRYINWNY